MFSMDGSIVAEFSGNRVTDGQNAIGWLTGRSKRNNPVVTALCQHIDATRGFLAKLQRLTRNPREVWKWYEARVTEESVGPHVPLVILVALALSACVARPRPGPVASALAAGPVADTVTVHLSNFAFTPENIWLQAGRPVTLVLINDADGGHDFSAPKLFAASTFPPGTAPPRDGAQEVDQHNQVELRFTPQKPGRYEVTCTHFMHELFGMSGNVEVLPAS